MNTLTHSPGFTGESTFLNFHAQQNVKVGGT